MIRHEPTTFRRGPNAGFAEGLDEVETQEEVDLRHKHHASYETNLPLLCTPYRVYTLYGDMHWPQLIANFDQHAIMTTDMATDTAKYKFNRALSL